MNVFTFSLFCIEVHTSRQCCPDQTPRFVASDLGLNYLHMYPRRISGF